MSGKAASTKQSIWPNGQLQAPFGAPVSLTGFADRARATDHLPIHEV